MDDCRKCKLKEICHSLPEDLTCEEVERIAKDDEAFNEKEHYEIAGIPLFDGD